MQNDDTLQIEENLVRNLARIFTEYGWAGRGSPKNFEQKLNIIAYGLAHGEALGYATHLKLLIQAREKDHKWGLFTPVFVKGVLNLFNAYASKYNYFERKPLSRSAVYEHPYGEISEDNIFKHLDYAKAAIKRLNSFGKTNIRYSLIEEYGEERVRKDLRAVAPLAELTVCYEDHEPDQLCEWAYDGGVTKMTLMHPIMPLVIISLTD